MIQLVFFAAISADGYLAGPDGDMSWAEKYLSQDEDYGFVDLMNATAAMLMGRKTFEMHQKAMGTEKQALPTYVLTNNPRRFDGLQDPNVHLIHGPIDAVIAELENHVDGVLLILGGADVARQAIESGRLDILRLFIAPENLAGGLKLFETELLADALSEYTLTDTKTFASTLVEQTYFRSR